MKKIYLLAALAAGLISNKANAQAHCGTDEMHQYYKQQNPDVAIYEKKLNESIRAFLAHANLHNTASKTTATHHDTDYYDIPVVVHVMHNYGVELLKDSSIHVMIANLNRFYSKQNNLTSVIQPFKKYIGNAKIRFRLASIDPNGQPTKGITHRLSYLTYGGDDQVKMDQWAPESYYNIWFENKIGRAPASGTILAYSTFPASAAAFPYSDGVISGYSYVNDLSTIEHETGHYFDLAHPWNSGAGVGEVCGDDEVDDTPPTKGHFSTCPLYDSTCAANYYKVYVSASGLSDSLVNYPDTTNVQNIMDYSSCTNMLTIGQVWRMRAALNSDMGGRNNLWDSVNLVKTGLAAPYPDLPPVTDFSVKTSNSGTSPLMYFTFPGVALSFTNKSWGDTITSIAWSFSNGATNPNPSFTTYGGINNPFPNSFADPGWVNIKLDATGNNSGTTSTNYPNAVFVADINPTNPLSGYYQEFSDGGDKAKWPMFNYYQNNFQWKLADYGVYDNKCVMYQGYETRTFPANLTGTPKGDYDDLYSVPFDLSAMTSGSCNLNFHFSGASRTSTSDNITDTMFVEYSVNKSHSWTTMAALTKDNLSNKGAVSTAYAPTSVMDWAPMTLNIPSAARTGYTVFRFRYKPGTFKAEAASNLSSGNNYYMDRIHISPWPADVSDVHMGSVDVKVVPNPTQGDAYVVIKDVQNSKAEIVVSDITGKVVYKTSEQLRGNAARILIPSSVIAVKGIYLVHTITGTQSNSQKLVVY